MVYLEILGTTLGLLFTAGIFLVAYFQYKFYKTKNAEKQATVKCKLHDNQLVEIESKLSTVDSLSQRLLDTIHQNEKIFTILENMTKEITALKIAVVVLETKVGD